MFCTEVKQTRDSIENFSANIAAGKKAQKKKDFMICAHIERLILERGMENTLTRAFAFVKAGVDAFDESAALDALDKFADKWDKKYPKISQSRRYFTTHF